MIEKQCASEGLKIKEYKTYLPSSEQDKCVLSLEPKSVPGWLIGPFPDQVNNEWLIFTLNYHILDIT